MRVRLLLIGCFLGLLWPCAAQSDPARPKSVLDDVPGLERPVTFTEPKIPLGELLRRVAQETGVKVYADRTTADEPAAVVVTGMPALRLLTQVARHFDYRWGREASPSGDRYRLYQDRQQQAEEEAHRAAAHADEQRRLQILLNAYVKVGQLSDAEYLAQRDELERRPPNSPRPSVEQDRLYRGLRECGDPAKRALARLLGRLTAADWQALWQGQRLHMYSKPETGERGLPQDISRSLLEFRPSLSWDLQQALTEHGEDRNAVAALRDNFERQDRVWAAAEGVRVTVRLHRASEMGRRFSRERAAPSLTASVAPLVNNPPNGAPMRVPTEQIRVWIWAATTQPAWGYDPPERLAALEKDPVFTAKQPFRPKTPPVQDWYGRPVYGQIPHLLPEIARTYRVSFLGDSYWPTPLIMGTAFPAPPTPGASPAGGEVPAAAPGAPAAEAPVEPMALGALLTKLSGHYERDINRITYNYYRWDRDDQLVLLRSRAWFFDRPKEIPVRLVSRWNKLFEEQGALPIEEYADGIASLTDDQWDSIGENGLSPVFQPGYNNIPSGETERVVLRLFRALNPAQRQRLLRGAPVPWLEMNAVQRELFLAVVEDQSLTSPVAITRADLAAASLILDFAPMDLVRRKKGTQQNEEPVQRGTEPGRYPEIFGDVAPAGEPQAPAAHPPAGAGAAAPAEPVSYTRFPVSMVRFMVRCGGANPVATTVMVSASRR